VIRGSAIVLLAAVALAVPRVTASGADFVAATANPANSFAAAADFNTVAVSMTDPGTPLHGQVTLAGSAASERGIAAVTFQAQLGAGAWTDACTATVAPYSCSWDTTTVADGSYALRAVATDAAGYARTSAVRSGRVVANTGPAVTLDDPGAYLQGTRTISATATDAGAGVAGLTLYWRRGGTTAWTTLCTGASSPRSCAFDSTTTADGDIELRAGAVDTVGNARFTPTLTRTVDNTAPAVATTDPGTLRGQAAIGATASDGAGTGVSSVTVQYRASGATAWTDVCTDTSAPYSCTLDTAALPDGLYDVRSTAVDGTGLAGTATVLTRRVDNAAPGISTLTDPGTMTGTVTLSGTAADAGSGVASWTVQYRPAGGGAWTDACADTAAPWASCSWNTSAVADGLYDLRAVAADAAGNTTASAVLTTRRVDNAGPAVTLADPGAYLRGAVTLTATATDPVGVASVVFQRKPTGGSTWTTICTTATAPYSCAWTTTGVADGVYDLRAQATDALGHVSAATVSGRTVDNTAPLPADVQAGNGGSTAGRIEAGDWLRFSWTETVSPASIKAGWDGTSTAISIKVIDGNKKDVLEVDDAAGNVQLNVAASAADLALNGDYVSATTVFDGTMVQSGAAITITVGARRSGAVKTATAATMTWKVHPATTDLAGNPIVAAASVTESGAADVDF
jgi:Bacterial Ig domain